MNHADLFAGIGGFSLSARWMGWDTLLQAEIDPFCQKVLRHHFPSSKHYGDIRTINGNEWRGRVDVLTGGFPCQPFSTAGQRRGEDDNRFLWPEMLRVIREIQPTFVVAENVRGLLTIDDGMVFERVCSELEEVGYEVQPFLIPACSVGAPHRRDRVWIVAHAASSGLEGGAGAGLQGRGDGPARGDWKMRWLEAATRLCRLDDGLPRELDGITVPRWRRESLKAYGNAIVPQIAFQIFQAIQNSEDANTN